MKTKKGRKNKNQTSLDDHLVLQPKILNRENEKNKQINKILVTR